MKKGKAKAARRKRARAEAAKLKTAKAATFRKLRSDPHYYDYYAPKIPRLDAAFDLPLDLIPTPGELLYYISHGIGCGNRCLWCANGATSRKIGGLRRRRKAGRYSPAFVERCLNCLSSSAENSGYSASAGIGRAAALSSMSSCSCVGGWVISISLFIRPRPTANAPAWAAFVFLLAQLPVPACNQPL